MSRQKSLIKERYSEPSSFVSLYAMREMAKGMNGGEVKATVNRFCHVIVAKIDGLKVDDDAGSQSISLCQSDTTRAYLVTTDVGLDVVFSPDDWEIARLARIDEPWQDLQEQKRSLCFVCLSVYEVPETELEAGTAFRIPTQKDGEILHTARSDSVIGVFRTSGLRRLPRPDMEPPYVEDAWVALTALLSAYKQGRQIRLAPNVFSETFHLTTDDDLVSEITPTMRARLTVVSPIDDAGLRGLGDEVNLIREGLQRRAAEKLGGKVVERIIRTQVGPKEGSVGSLVDAILGEYVYAKEDTVRLRYIRLWQALVDASGEGNLAKVGALAEHDPKVLDNTRNRIAHPARLPIDSELALDKLRKAALAWVRELT